jgi:hypothetical protein
MQCTAVSSVTSPLPRSAGLDKADCIQLLTYLDGCLAVFDRRIGSLSASEVRLKTMLSIMRSEVIDRIRTLGAATEGS